MEKLTKTILKLIIVISITFIIFTVLKNIQFTILLVFLLLTIKHSTDKDFKFSELFNDLLGMLIGMLLI